MFRSAAAFLVFLLLASASAGQSLRSDKDFGPRALRWEKNRLTVHISQSLLHPSSNIKAGTDVSAAVDASLESWSRVSNVSFQKSITDKSSVSAAGIAGDGISLISIGQTPENSLFFEKGVSDASARTRVFVDKRGVITEADIILNPFLQFSSDGTYGTYDLQSVITHEIGHLLGLDHSSILGSTMHAEIGKNGVFGIQSRFIRTLSGSDIAAIRSLYGNNSSEDCCGSIVGKVGMRSARELSIWAEDIETGMVAGLASISRDGTFYINGLQPGEYRVIAQNGSTKLLKAGSDEIDTVQVVKNKAVKVNGALKVPTVGFDLHYIGLGGQLAEVALPLNAGRTYTVLVAGTNLTTDKLRVDSDSPFIEVISETQTNVDFNDDVSAISVSVRIRPNTPAGDYSLYIQNKTGHRRYLPGAITIETFEDPLSLFLGSSY